MIPGWKVRREIQRFRQQLSWYWERLLAPARTRRHDRDRATLVRQSEGVLPQGSRIAAFLIFQPGPLPASIVETCDLLTGLGYSVLIVSNGPLRPEARDALLPQVWRLLERPNLGYDFGGYREAVMHLWDQGLEPEELLILNDSVWILAPVLPAFLSWLAASSGEVGGAVRRSKKGRHWLESYAFRFTRDAFVHHAFRDFWQGYRLVDSKFGVIRQGERDLSVTLGAGGLRLAALGDNQGFLDRMAAAPDEELRLAIAYSASVQGGLAEDRARLLADTTAPHWRTQVLAHLQTSLDGKRVWNAQFPIAAIRVMDYPFVKKSREPVNAEWRSALLRGIADNVVPGPSPAVLGEMKARQELGSLASPHWISAAPD